MEFKEKLKKLRNERDISQQTLADAIFVSRSAVAKWENGLGLPCEESYNAIANYFEVTTDYLKTDEPEKIIIEKNKKLHRLSTIFGAVILVLLFTISTLLIASTMSRTYGLTSKMAAGYFSDNPYIKTDDYDIYYSTMDILYHEELDESLEHIVSFRPVKRLFIGYGVFEEDYAYRKLYANGNFVGFLYSLEGDNCYYNIITKNAHIIPTDLLVFEKINVNGEEYEVTLNSYFVTPNKVETLVIGDTTLEIGNLELK